MIISLFRWFKWKYTFITCALLLQGCAHTVEYDYSVYEQHKPKSILVLPPINRSTDVDATKAIYSSITRPLAESGYYVLPVPVVEHFLAENGFISNEEIHRIPRQQLKDTFGADAVLYVEVLDYGLHYLVIDSSIVAKIQARLVDLDTGLLLWEGRSSASRGLFEVGVGVEAMLIGALVAQVLNADNHELKFKVGADANNLLLYAHNEGSLLYGHRSPLAKDYNPKLEEEAKKIPREPFVPKYLREW